MSDHVEYYVLIREIKKDSKKHGFEQRFIKNVGPMTKKEAEAYVSNRKLHGRKQSMKILKYRNGINEPF